jgi:hypothetical protein
LEVRVSISAPSPGISRIRSSGIQVGLESTLSDPLQPPVSNTEAPNGGSGESHRRRHSHRINVHNRADRPAQRIEDQDPLKDLKSIPREPRFDSRAHSKVNASSILLTLFQGRDPQ